MNSWPENAIQIFSYFKISKIIDKINEVKIVKNEHMSNLTK
jgi:hypothetical protein